MVVASVSILICPPSIYRMLRWNQRNHYPHSLLSPIFTILPSITSNFAQVPSFVPSSFLLPHPLQARFLKACMRYGRDTYGV